MTHGVFARAGLGTMPAFQPAITIRGTVGSRPEPRLVIVDVGKRDLAVDVEFPVVIAVERRGRGSLAKSWPYDRRHR